MTTRVDALSTTGKIPHVRVHISHCSYSANPSYTMGFTTSLIGGALGFSAQCMSNSIQKIPLSRRKYQCLLLFGMFAAGQHRLTYRMMLVLCYIYRTMDARFLYAGRSLGCEQMGSSGKQSLGRYK
jgi:hypothetical protein